MRIRFWVHGKRLRIIILYVYQDSRSYRMCFYKPFGIPYGPSMGGGYVMIHTQRRRGRSYSFVLEALYWRHGFGGPLVVGRIALIIRRQAI